MPRLDSPSYHGAAYNQFRIIMQSTALDNNQPLSSYEMQAESNRRIHQRVQTQLDGRFMRTTKEEHSCTILDVSVGGISIESTVQVVPGEKIICYIQEIGRVEGVVVRNHDTGFALQFIMSGRALDKLADHLTWLVNRQHLKTQDQRSSIRRIPEKSLSIMTLADGSQEMISLLDVSIGGAMIKSEIRPTLNSNIHLGTLRAKVLRHHSEGFSVIFLDTQHPGLSNR